MKAILEVDPPTGINAPCPYGDGGVVTSLAPGAPPYGAVWRCSALPPDAPAHNELSPAGELAPPLAAPPAAAAAEDLIANEFDREVFDREVVRLRLGMSGMEERYNVLAKSEISLRVNLCDAQDNNKRLEAQRDEVERVNREQFGQLQFALDRVTALNRELEAERRLNAQHRETIARLEAELNAADELLSERTS